MSPYLNKALSFIAVYDPAFVCFFHNTYHHLIDYTFMGIFYKLCFPLHVSCM